ncbi:MAG: methylmalonyl-CoA mutase [Chloroflexi bacterium]|nr:methylmalonyl-CoA mutase [Chloroflexota bacterium]
MLTQKARSRVDGKPRTRGNGTRKAAHRVTTALFVEEALVQVSHHQQEWERGVLRARLARGQERPLTTRTGSGDIPIKRTYTPLDIAGTDYAQDIGMPGGYPFTRGADPIMYRGMEWPAYFYAGYGSSEDANAYYKDLIAKGATHVSLALDLPSQVGYDADHPAARGDVGKSGVALNSLRDLELILDGIPLEKITTGTVGNCIGPIMLAMFIVLGEKRGVPIEQMHVHLQNDPLKEYTGRGTYIIPVRPAVDLAADMVSYALRHAPRWTSQYVCATQIRWGGATAVQEAAFGLAHVLAYVEAARSKGVPLEEYVPRIDLHMTVDNDLFEEVAKYRAVRRLWARMAQERFGTDDPRVLCLKTTTYTAGHRMTAQEPLNNVVRTTVHVLAAFLGGTHSIHAPAYDEALALPTPESARLAQMTQQLLFYESGACSVVDPLAGSYYVEWLTSEIEKRARAYLKKIEALGGAIGAIEKGYIQREMAEWAYRYQKEVQSGERPVIGVNKFSLDKPIEIKTFRHNPEAERRQIERLRQLRVERDNARVQECLRHVKETAIRKRSNPNAENIVGPILECVRAYGTIGEICDVLREVYGEYVPPSFN